MGAPDVDPPCGATTDQDCVPPPGSIGPSDGTGPGLVINANLIMGNAAESGSGGGLRLAERQRHGCGQLPRRLRARWNSVTVTNNIIANNVAGWDGAGISLLDALEVNIINNTIVSNDTTASSGVLFNTLLARRWPAPREPTASQTGSTTASCPQAAGLVSIQNSAVLEANLPCRDDGLDHLPGGPWDQRNQRSLQELLGPAAVQRRVLAEPFVLHRRGRPRYGNPEPAERGHAV